MCLWRRTSVHHVRARTPRFASGGDDYLFILFDGSCKVCATTSPAAALAAAAAAICAPPLGMRCAIAAHTYPPPMALTGCGLLPHARSSWQLGWRVSSGKFRSGLLPQFEHQPRAQLFCMFGPLIVRMPHTSLYATVFVVRDAWTRALFGHLYSMQIH
jgi:hypothetical protein